MYCSKCGAKIEEKSEFCSECGNQLKELKNTNQEVSESSSSIGWGVLGFFVPLAGLILYLVWKNDRPNDAKAAGIGALIWVGLYLLLIILAIAMAFFAVNA